MLAGALLWYVVKPYPFLPRFVFTATMLGLVIVAYLVDHSHLDIKRGRKRLVASRLVLLWLPLSASSYFIPDDYGTPAAFK